MVITFRDLFIRATGIEHGPYCFQERLAESAALPKLLDIPTGLGKTAGVVLAWIWRRRFASAEIHRQTPRRLVYCLPMRVLVQQTHRETVRWLARIELLAGEAEWSNTEHDGIPTPAAELRRYEPDPQSGERIAVHLLMGGEERTDWAIWPERDAILIGTQDMLLSRALNRGYAAGRARWPMEFGLLNNDCLWVFDEVQLMGSGLATSLQLQAWRESLPLRPSQDRFPEAVENPVFGPARSLWMSATTARHWFEKAIDWRSRSEDAWNERERLREDERGAGCVGRLLQNTKTLSTPIAELKIADKRKGEAATGEYLRTVADQIRQHPNDGLTLVIMNTVERVVGLFDLLAGPNVHLIHSQFRPHERQRWQGILSRDNTTPRLIISTQVVEAGVDLSARVLFTELAPWASLVQRFGRCARYAGEAGTVYWMDLREGAEKPYEAEDLEPARERLQTLRGVGLRELAELKASLEQETDEARRLREALLPYDPRFVPREKDLFELFDTTPDLTGADIDISRFIRDGRELDVMVYWRDVTEREPAKRDRPLREELCPVPFYRFKERIGELLKHGRIWKRHYRKGWEPADAASAETIYPGQVFLLERSCGGYSERRGWTGDPDDQVTWIGAAAPVERAENEEVEESDDQCESQWLTIEEHCRHVRDKLEEILRSDAGVASHANVLSLSARWHDRGKAHPAFKAKFRDGALESDQARQRLGGEPAAKGPGEAWRVPRDPLLPRPGFRHELASALAALETLRAARPDHPGFAWPDGLEPPRSGEPPPSFDAADDRTLIDELAGLSDNLDLFAYLVASHHGKVRMSLRSSPDDSKTTIPDPCPGELRQARGVRDGDDVPACGLPGPDGSVLRAPNVKVYLDPMELGLSERYGPSWRERTQALLERFGPFRLAYLEALLRAADWRASSEERGPVLEERGETYVREEAEEYGRNREDLRDFVRRWTALGPLLEEERYAALQELGDERARQITLDLFKLWRPRTVDTMGGGLAEAQKVFIQLARREAGEQSRR
jgi:CRISPR-associated endonuclease/helicase Cas3